MKHIYIIIFISVLPFLSVAQNTIIGQVVNNEHKNDTLLFINSNISVAYYQYKNLSAPVVNGSFTLGYFDYPQLYYTVFKTEHDSISYRIGQYFLEKDTKSITVDIDYIKSKGDGKAFTEYQNKFIPYMLHGTNYKYVDWLMHEDTAAFTQKLAAYVKQNPYSYSALWHLIILITEKGFKAEYETIAKQFSKGIKQSKPWQVLNTELNKIVIREGKKFPEITLQNIALKTAKVQPRAQYTLVDFWWSRCKPCLEQMPHLKELYSQYNKNGFDIIGIAADNTPQIDLWKKRITDNAMPWKNYLDENKVFTFSQKIFSFPTNYLLDKNNVVIRKNISPEELELFLKENLHG